MKNAWVSNITDFFENINKQNFRNSFKCTRNINMDNSKSDKQISVEDRNRSIDSYSSEHCCTIEKAKYIFEKMNFANHREINNSKSKPSLTTVSSFDIFSGNVVDCDIPSIEAEIEEDGVYPCADLGPIGNELACSANSGQVVKRKKSSMKNNNSYSNRKSNYKKSIPGCIYSLESEVDKENDGVIIRMKDQEKYYDGKDKYQSQLPPPPVYKLNENTQTRRSNFASKGSHKSVDCSDKETDRKVIQNSIIYSDFPLPSVDTNNRMSEHRQTMEEDNDSIELEPNIDNDSYPENRIIQLFSADSQRLRWAETEEGIKLIKMQKLSDETIKWQESQFEVITSEASYYRSLEILVNKIYKSSLFDCCKVKRITSTLESSPNETDECCHTLNKPTISATQKHHLFSNILEIHIVSGELLKALESRWRENPLIMDLSDILVEFCVEKLKPYVTYLRNQRYQTDTYNKLLNLPEFVNIIKTFEQDPDCLMMNLCSFLMLPMQRVLRLKLLMTVVKKHTPKHMSTTGCDQALEALDKLIKECSDGKMVMEQKEEILLICNRLIIKDKMNVSIGSKPLLKSGQLKITSANNIASRSLGGRFARRNSNRVQLYLFEDYLIVSKKRKLPLCVSSDEEREVVVDTCPRNEVQFSTYTDSSKLINRPSCNNFKLTLLKGKNGCSEYVCTADTQDELSEWKRVFSSDNILTDGFEFNEVFVVEDYKAVSKKELDIKKGQILNIIKRIDTNRVIASSGDRRGEIYLKNVQFLSSPQTNPDFLKEMSFTVTSKKFH